MNESPNLESDDDLLDRVQRASFGYFRALGGFAHGLVADSSAPRSNASIAAVGFALSSYPVAVERGWMPRAEALDRTLAALRFFDGADQSGAPDGVGHRGFFYHFLDLRRARRAPGCELSTIDTALLIAGVLVAAEYFDGAAEGEAEVRAKARSIYDRVDWRWAQNGGQALSMGWTPEKGFIPARWVGYNEALILYVLALGSSTYPVDPSAYEAWLSGFRWKRIYGHAHVYAGPLFIHQFSHVWLDLRGIHDAYMAPRKIDYFENSRRATYVQCEYGRRNPRGFAHYHPLSWGWTASNGPGPITRVHRGQTRRFFGYHARGVPFGPDDGTVAPWASVASLPFAPELVMPTLHHLASLSFDAGSPFGFCASFNRLFHEKRGDAFWVSPWHYGINQGPIVAMIENHRTGLLWRLIRKCEPVVRGLRRAGFTGAWLEQ